MNGGYNRGEFSPSFEKKLNGELKDLITYASDINNGLDVQFRGNYINIYYKGASILKVDSISLIFNNKYFHSLVEKEKDSSRISNIKKAVKWGGYKSISQEKALQILDELKKKETELLELVNDPEKYFSKAKKVIDTWFLVMEEQRINKHKENNTQHKISLCNRSFDNSDLIVLDLEYVINKNCSFFSNTGNPRPDIIALDKKGCIHVMELKYGLEATEGSAGVKKHILDFEETIKKDEKDDFKNEMKVLFDAKCRYSLLNCPEGFHFSETEKPVFDLIFCGSKDDFKTFEENYGGYRDNGRVADIYYLTEGSYYLLKNKK